MRQPFHLLIILLLLNGKITLNAQLPNAPSRPVTETYFGKPITDRYRNLENLQDDAVRQWMKVQSDYTRTILNSITGRQSLIDKMKDFDSRKSAQVANLVITSNDIYFYLKTTPEDETAKLYTRNGLAGNETLLFDVTSYTKEGSQKYVIQNHYPSDDGSLVAIKIAANGSESSVLVIMNVKDKNFYPEKIDRCFGRVSWLPDNSAFFINRFQTSDVHDQQRSKNTTVYLHKPGADPSTDRAFFSGAKYPDLGVKPEQIPQIIYDQDSHSLFAFLIVSDSRLNCFYAPTSELNNLSIKWKRLFKPEDGVYDFTATDKDLFVLTSKNAPHFKIIKIPLQYPDLLNAKVIIAEDTGVTITSLKLTNEGLYYTVTKNGVEAVLYHLPDGSHKAEQIKLPFAAGSIALSGKGAGDRFMGMGGFKYPDIWVTMSGWTSESKRWRYLPGRNEFKPEALSTEAAYPELADLVVEEVTIPSHDGVKIPLSLVFKKGIKKDGTNPLFLSGYGAYGIAQTPRFSPFLLVWTTEGGVVALAHVRGGGELGEKWHKEGYKTTKPNTWKDLISCAQFLINEKYTSSQKLAIQGGSAGGILIGRAMTERPDLFAVAIPDVGVMNPLRFEETPGGPANIGEFGTVKDSIECMALIEMDAYLHLKRGEKYPATLVTAGMNDPRVIAWQPAKFAAGLQADNASVKPILFRVDYEAGHGYGDPKSKAFEKYADFFSFALWQLGHPDFQLK